MARILIANATIFDGTGGAAYPGEVLVEDNRIAAVSRNSDEIDRANAEIVDGGGATLMPGLVEGHAHLTYPFSVDRRPLPGGSILDIHLPVEQATFVTAHNAKTILDYGYTSAYSAGGSTELMEVTLRKEIDGGWLPGRRFRAAGSEGVLASNDANVHHTTDVDGVVQFVRRTADVGAEIAKFILSGPGFTPDQDKQCMYSDEQLAAAGRAAKECGVWLSGHARFNAALKQALRYGWRVIYHADQLDEETLDMMEARKDEIFIGPTIGLLTSLFNNARAEGEKRGLGFGLQMYRNNTAQMLKRGIRVMPCGDYGFSPIPHGSQSRDLEHFVTHLGLTPAQALVSATRWGGELMDMKVGLVRDGFLADLLLVKGDPVTDISLLQDKNNLLMIMKDGRYHKAPQAAAMARAPQHAA